METLSCNIPSALYTRLNQTLDSGQTFICTCDDETDENSVHRTITRLISGRLVVLDGEQAGCILVANARKKKKRNVLPMTAEEQEEFKTIVDGDEYETWLKSNKEKHALRKVHACLDKEQCCISCTVKELHGALRDTIPMPIILDQLEKKVDSTLESEFEMWIMIKCEVCLHWNKEIVPKSWSHINCVICRETIIAHRPSLTFPCPHCGQDGIPVDDMHWCTQDCEGCDESVTNAFHVGCECKVHGTCFYPKKHTSCITQCLENKPKICGQCNSLKPRKRCQQCGVQSYCDEDCQRLHWSMHKDQCSLMKS